jgi:hypothetical protein
VKQNHARLQHNGLPHSPSILELRQVETDNRIPKQIYLVERQ